MNILNLRKLLEEKLSEYIRELWQIDQDVKLSEPRDREFGDISSQISLTIAGKLGKRPREIASQLREKILDTSEGLENCTVDGPGFLNFTFSLEYLEQVILELKNNGLQNLLPHPGAGKRALVEFVSTNPTGPLTVGHCRQAVLGDAIARLLHATGWNVEREYYYNDSGRQITLLGQSLAARYYSLTGREMEIPEDGYRGEYLNRWAKNFLSETGPSLSWPEDEKRFISKALEEAMTWIEEDLKLLGISFDRYFRETELIPEKTEAVIEKMKNIKTDKGPFVFNDPETENKLWLNLTALDRPEDRVIKRSDGRYTYRLPDIAYHVDKFERNYDLMVDIFGSDHLDTSRDVVTALYELLGRKTVDKKLRIVIHQFVTLVRAGQKVKMSTRKANYVTLRGLVDEVGSVDVTRYLFLTRKPGAHMDFDLDLARSQSEDNPVYYIQYAFARINGVLRNAIKEGFDPDTVSFSPDRLLDDPRERELMRILESVPSKILAAAESLEPHRITEIMAGIATAFHSFYHHVRILQAGSRNLTEARLVLTSATGRVIRELLEILGINAPERM